jgi:CheY-like chemotaxis protein
VTNPVQPIEVLLVEDDPGDELMTREAFEDNKIRNTLHVVRDGQEALDFLYRRGAYGDAPRPDLILLDLNLPRYDGRQVLEQIKQDPELSLIPVVVLTTSSAEEDILRSYKLHANAYVTKPVDLDQFIAAVRQIDEFFVTVVRLPGRAEYPPTSPGSGISRRGYTISEKRGPTASPPRPGWST